MSTFFICYANQAKRISQENYIETKAKKKKKFKNNFF